jgi:hypothetical protein
MFLKPEALKQETLKPIQALKHEALKLQRRNLKR